MTDLAASLPAHAAFHLDARRDTDRGPALLLRHAQSGARLLWLPGPAAEAVFTVSFPTRPQDDRGAAHVLEHLIFRGSEAYPADPLYPALTEATMVSFLNASTRPDYTTFHAASPAAEGILPLVTVLLDAVFHPRLRVDAFREEAWDRPAPGGAARGIILSEMRDYLASPEVALSLALRAAVLSGGDGAFNQGGDPARLTELTLGDVEAFHRAAFTPANAWLTLQGATGAALPLIDAPLRRAVRAGDRPADPPRAGRAAPLVHFSHPAGRGDCGLAWPLPTACPPELAVLLDSLLLSGPGAVLRDLPGLVPGPATALQRDLAHPYLSLALAPGAEPALRARLTALCTKLPEAAIRAALNHAVAGWYDAEQSPRRPAGLCLVDPLIAPWLAGGDAFALLDIGARLQHLRAHPDQAQALLQGLLRALFAEGGPESRVLQTAEAQPHAALKPPPAGRALPFHPLSLSGPAPDLPEVLPSFEMESAGPITRLPPGADRLARLRLAFVLEPGPTAALAGSAAALERRMTADRRLGPWARGLRARAGACGAKAVLWVQFSALPEDVEAACDALGDLLTAMAKPALDEAHAPLRRAMISRPQNVIPLRLRARLSTEAALQDALAGPGLLLAPPATTAEAVPLLLGRARLLIAASGAPEAPLRALADLFSQKCLGESEPAPAPFHLPETGDGFALPVGFHAVGLGFHSPQPAAARVLLRAAEAAVLWPEIRGAGGAYGLRSELSSSGEGVIFTARDPHLLRSLDLLRGAMAGLRGAITPELLQRCRNGAAGQLLTPLDAQELLNEVLRARICGTAFRAAASAELRALHALTPDALRDGCEALHLALSLAPPVVFGPEESLRAALRQRPGLFTLHSDR